MPWAITIATGPIPLSRGSPAEPRIRLDGSHTSIRRCHDLTLLAESVNPKPHAVAGPQEHRRVLAHANARRRAGGNDVAGLQAHEMADIADEPRHAEDHVLGHAILIATGRRPRATDPDSAGPAPRPRVTSQGPIGPNESALLPLTHWPVPSS